MVLLLNPSVGIKSLHSDLKVTTAKLVALRNFVKKKLLLHSRFVCYKEMDQDSAHMVVASKMPMLNQFNSIKDAKSLLQAVKKRFGGNAATKKTKRNLLKQQYENFTASSSKIYKPEVKGTSRSSTNTQNVAFVSSNSTNSTNRAVNTTRGVATASTQATTVNSTTIDNLSDVVICAFFMAMLTIKARGFLKNTERKFSVNGTETIGFDKSKVECYNYHKRGHFARECRAPRNKENKNRENTRKVVLVETTTSNDFISCDGLGDYD
ncbi:ribonuclease H-like domain-containing protein [Tanacetum coccineum]